jgi:hypothetical protein
MPTYRVRYRNGESRDLVADWMERRNGMVFFMRETPSHVGVPWPEGDGGQGGTPVEAVPANAIEDVDHVARPRQAGVF